VTLPPRELVVGVEVQGAAMAYTLDALRDSRLIVDTLRGTPIAVVLAADGKSVRVFSRRVGERVLSLFVKPDGPSTTLVDAETGSEWDFSGRAAGGPLEGAQLERIPALTEFWFDWKAYHPDTRIHDGV
jgi:hypothetical protein